LPARRNRPCDDADWIVRFDVCSTAPGACRITPNIALWIVACSNETAVALGVTITPYQLPEVVVDDRNVTGCAVVPLTSSVPSMMSSTRVVCWPAPWASLFAVARTSTPGPIVSVAPIGTVTSPCRMYGLPAAVHVLAAPGRLPPAMIVSAEAEVAAAARATAVVATREARRGIEELLERRVRSGRDPHIPGRTDRAPL
jgi:hypothetical protein